MSPSVEDPDSRLGQFIFVEREMRKWGNFVVAAVVKEDWRTFRQL